MKILIVDDHAIVRRGLQQIVLDEYEDIVFGEATNGQEALDALSEQDWDVIVLDISMPGRSGLDVLKEIRKQRPSVPVLVLSVHPEDQFAVRVLRAGASGYMTKETAPEELVNAINRIVQGGRYVSSTLAEILARDLSRDLRGGVPHQQLSDREFQVLRMMAGGKTITEVARELSLSVKTVSTYRARVLEKLKLKNSAEAIRYAVDHQLVD